MLEHQNFFALAIPEHYFRNRLASAIRLIVYQITITSKKPKNKTNNFDYF